MKTTTQAADDLQAAVDAVARASASVAAAAALASEAEKPKAAAAVNAVARASASVAAAAALSSEAEKPKAAAAVRAVARASAAVAVAAASAAEREEAPAARDLEAAVTAVALAVEAVAAAEEEKKAPAAKKVAEEEDPRLRWAFVRKVYTILALQFALTAAVAATACFVRPIPRFFVDGPPAAVWPTYIAILVSPLIVMFPMLKYREKHPRNLVLLALFTLCCSLSIAVSASTTLGAVVLQATILTAASVVGLTLFTFWAVKKGLDFTFTGPFLFTCLLVLLVYTTIQIFFPLGRVGMTVYGFLATLVFSGFIVYDTNMLLKRHTYNEYVVAAISLYLDVINLFMAQMSLSCN